jgi:esterase/lipase superfamily enzyme
MTDIALSEILAQALKPHPFPGLDAPLGRVLSSPQERRKYVETVVQMARNQGLLVSIDQLPDRPETTFQDLLNALRLVASVPPDIVSKPAPVSYTAKADESDDEESEASPGGTTFEVWFATNRAPVSAGSPSPGFDNRLDPQGAVHYGKCWVTVPRNHVFGSVGTPWWKRWASFRFEDDHLRLKKIAIEPDERSFFNSVRAELASHAITDRQVLVYLHGYNVGFEGAAIRAAQIGVDLKIRGVTAFFSWPSCASVTGYLADADRIAASEKQIATFLTAIVQQTGAEHVHILAHSMGNRGLGRAIERIMADAVSRSGIRFGHIILAAPDVEVNLFTDLSRVYPQVSLRTTMYVSARDKALGLSKWLQDSDRAGFTPPVTIVPDIDTIEVTDIDLTLLGHGYYANAEGVLRDIYELLNFNAPPEKRARTRFAPEKKYWTIGR